MSCFEINKQCIKTSARIGKLKTSHGNIDTPTFMPVGTYAAIKTLSTDENTILQNFNEKDLENPNQDAI